MSHILASSVLSDEGVMTLLTAAISAASQMGQPQCIVIVDQSGVTLGSFRMRGSRFQSLKSALAKALTSASIGAPSHSLAEHARVPLAIATHGGVAGLAGGVPTPGGPTDQASAKPMAIPGSTASASAQVRVSRTNRLPAPLSRRLARISTRSGIGAKPIFVCGRVGFAPIWVQAKTI